jgi:hypothetical protein
MKDAKFIELLNLYVDQQIDSADAALLEEEITRSAARRRTYQQYCRMHKACSVMFEQARPASAVGEKLAAAAAAADEKIVAFPEKQRRPSRVVYWGGLAAAAACVAFVLSSRPVPKQPAGDVAVVPNNTAEQIVTITPEPSPLSRTTNLDRAKYQPVLVNHTRSASGLVRVDSGRPSLDWVNNVQLSPLKLSTEELFFEPRPTLKTEQNVFRSGRPVPVNAESAAYQFQR